MAENTTARRGRVSVVGVIFALLYAWAMHAFSFTHFPTALTAGLWAAKVTVIIAPLSFGLLVAMTGFEVLVSFLQAFIFTILTAVYIDISMHPAH